MHAQNLLVSFFTGQIFILIIITNLNPMAGRPCLPGNAKESTAAATLAANSGLWTLGVNRDWTEDLISFSDKFKGQTMTNIHDLHNTIKEARYLFHWSFHVTHNQVNSSFSLSWIINYYLKFD